MTTIISQDVPPQFRTRVVWACLVFMLILGSHIWWDYATSSPIEHLSDPVSAVADSIGPELEFFDGLQALPVWQQKLLNFPEISRKKFVDNAILTWRDVISSELNYTDENDPQILESARVYLLILLAEERGWDSASAELESWQDANGPLIRYVVSIYTNSEQLDKPAHLFFDRYPWNWATLRMNRQAARASKNNLQLETINASIQRTADSQVHRTIIYSIVWWSIILTGLATVFYFFKTVHSAENRYQVAWPLRDALGVFLLAEILTDILYLSSSIWPAEYPLLSLYYTWPSLWSGLIAILLIYFYLTGPRRVSMRDSFGLSLLRVNGFIPLLLWIIAVSTLDNLGLMGINFVYDSLGFSNTWTEGLSEILLWGTPREVMLESIDSVLWAPIFEEILFRGVLYLGLRQYCSPLVAALLSASIFSLLHFYSFLGFLEVLWGGIVFALAFEYSRSLLPAIGSHILYNLNWLLYSLIYYRI